MLSEPRRGRVSGLKLFHTTKSGVTEVAPRLAEGRGGCGGPCRGAHGDAAGCPFSGERVRHGAGSWGPNRLARVGRERVAGHGGIQALRRCQRHQPGPVLPPPACPGCPSRLRSSVARRKPPPRGPSTRRRANGGRCCDPRSPRRATAPIHDPLRNGLLCKLRSSATLKGNATAAPGGGPYGAPVLRSSAAP